MSLNSIICGRNLSIFKKQIHFRTCRPPNYLSYLSVGGKFSWMSLLSMSTNTKFVSVSQPWSSSPYALISKAISPICNNTSRSSTIFEGVSIVPSRQLQISTKDKRKQQQFKPQYKRDKVPRHFDLIYVSSLRHWIDAAKIGLNLMTVCVLISAAYQIPQLTLDTLITLKGFFLCTVPFASIGFCVGAALLTRPVLTRIYFDQENGNFIGIRRTFFGRLIQIPYKLQDITLKPSSKSPETETWDSLSLTIQNHSVYLLSSDFINLQYFNMHVEQQMSLAKSSLAKEHIF